MIEALLADNLGELVGVRHGFFTRRGAEGAHAPLYRQRVAESIGVEAGNLLTCSQTHSSLVVTVKAPWGEDTQPQADAMVTNEKDIALGILTADCVPVLFADAAGCVVGAVHAGWRGALCGALDNTVAAMEKLGAARARVRAAIGPCIWQASYEVGPEFPLPFLAENPVHKKFFMPAFRSGHFMFDLPGYVAAKLKMLGIHNVEESPADTFQDERRFFSYRRGCLFGIAGGGRLISAIAMRSSQAVSA